MLTPIAGKSVVVTGASKGIGLAIARSLSAAGYPVVGLALREAVGKATGNRGTQMRGTAEKMAGKMQAKLGAAADAVRRIKK